MSDTNKQIAPLATNNQAIPIDVMEKLRAFQRQAEWLRNSKVLSTGKVQLKFSVTFSMETKDSTHSFQGYDNEQFLAILPVLRQFILNDEPVNMLRIHNLIMKECDREDIKSWVVYTRKGWMETLNGIPSDHLIFFHNCGTVTEAVQQLFYGFGGLFHVQLDEPRLDDQQQLILTAALHKAFPRLWNSIRNMESLIHAWLDDPGFPLPPIPTLPK